MKTVLYFLLSAFITKTALAQKYFVKGNVKNKSTGAALSYTNIRVVNSTFGTSANENGEYELRLESGSYKLIASCIGFISDTVSISLNKNLYGVNFEMSETNINLPAITVLPGENPAIPIIKKAIERKKERDNNLLSYEYDAYTKGILLSQQDVSSTGRNVSIGLGSDTSALKITGIIENESKGFFKKPDLKKEEIIARKQSANFPSSINVFTGGRVMQNFYDNKINFFGEDLPGPLADDALSYYYFSLGKTLAIDNKPVYQIHVEPDDPHDPGFTGNIFITDSTFDLIKVELGLNRAANTGGLYDSIKVFQQFSEFSDSIYMPVDYRVFAAINYLSLVKFGFELNTILYDYEINPVINNDVFSKAIITVLPGADKKDSTYWKDAVTIPNTLNEISAYKRIDSLESVPRSIWSNFNILSTRMDLSDNFSISATLGMYHFNRVEGHTLDFGLNLHDAADKRLNSSIQLDYGFSDKRFKTDFNASYLFGDYRTYKISLEAFNKLNILFGSPDGYNQLTSTLLALLSKYEFNNYYYSRGFNLEASGDIFPVLSLSLGFENHTDKNAFNNSNFSFFYKDRTYSLNPPIYETKINSITAGFNFDFRDYIEDGFFRRRVTLGKPYATFGGKVIYSNEELLKSNLNFTTYEFNSQGSINTFGTAQLYFRIFGMYTNGSLPYQMLYTIPGNIDLTARFFTFRTLNLNEILGDRVFTVNLEHVFGSELFRLIPIPFIQDADLQLGGFLNIAYSDAGIKTNSISPYPLKTFRHPFYEAGFWLGQALLPLQLDFAWRLNYRGENNFRIGINTFVY